MIRRCLQTHVLLNMSLNFPECNYIIRIKFSPTHINLLINSYLHYLNSNKFPKQKATSVNDINYNFSVNYKTNNEAGREKEQK